MKYLILIMLLMSSQAFGYIYSEETGELVCARMKESASHNGVSVSVSCVSKISIEKDKAELKLIRLQIKKLEMELKKEQQNEIK